MKAKKKLLHLFWSIALLSMYGTNYAQAALIECGYADQPMCTWPDVIKTVQNLVNFAILYVAIPMCSIVAIIGGLEMLLSAGNETKYKSGRKKIEGVAIGLAITFGAWLIVETVTSIVFT